MSESLPETLTLDEAFRAAYYMADQYVALEREPDVGLVLFRQYLRSDPARWEDWTVAVRRVKRRRAAGSATRPSRPSPGR